MRQILALLAAVFSLHAAFAHPDQEPDSLIIMADAAYDDERFADCAKLYVQAIENGQQGAELFYNAACCFALSGDTSAAFFYLDEAVDHDYTRVQHLNDDPDLESLRADPRWPQLVERTVAAERAYLKREGLNEELFYMMKEDQAARKDSYEEINWDSVVVKDRERLARVKEMTDKGELRAAQDFLNAALIFQHGEDSTDYRRAHELSLQAVKLDSTSGSAKWLAAAAWDRYLQSMNMPQIYGTQYQKNDSGKWTLDPIDTTAVSDQERARWNVPPLAESRRHVAEMNGKESKP